MLSRVSLTLFSHVCSKPEEDLDLAEAALLIAESEYPGLDIARYVGMLEDMGRKARALGESGRLARLDTADGSGPLRLVLRWLYQGLGFRGNDGDYYDPRNSFLNDVLDRRTGIPISLGVVLVEVCRRAGIEAHGVSFPSHFLVRVEAPRAPLFIDPFTGRLLSGEDLREMHARAVGGDAGEAEELREPSPRLLAAATKRQVLLRMLNNLRGIYTSRSDHPRLRAVLERMQVLAPSEEMRRELAQLGGESPWPSGTRAVH
jgi:regulator of sirC expression with transglutaminase-like and TPR domain